MNLTLKNNLPKETTFLPKLKEICSWLGVDVDSMLAVMFSESRIKPEAHNKKSGASGLIQFMPATAKGLGTTTTAIRQMTGTAQLDYVKKYFAPYKDKMKSIHDLYAVVFFPVMVGKSASYILQTKNLSAETIAKANPIFDINKNLQITKAEFNKYIDTALLPLAGIMPKKKRLILFSLLTILLLTGFYYVKKSKFKR